VIVLLFFLGLELSISRLEPPTLLRFRKGSR
jgi:hypothetical protein